jgi:hypothetical protein
MYWRIHGNDYSKSEVDFFKKILMKTVEIGSPTWITYALDGGIVA